MVQLSLSILTSPANAEITVVIVKRAIKIFFILKQSCAAKVQKNADTGKFLRKIMRFLCNFAGITGNFVCLSQASQHFDAINRPVRYFLNAGSNTRNVEQQESKGHESRHPDDLAEDLLECYGHDALRQS